LIAAMRSLLVLAVVTGPTIVLADPPEAADEVRYHFSIRYASESKPIEDYDKTEPLSAIEPYSQHDPDAFLTMRPGDVRTFRYTSIDGYTADHFGGRTVTFVETIKLLEVISHHDELPDDMHIGSYPLHVRSGAIKATLPGELVKQIDSVRVTGGSVVIEAIVDTQAGPQKTKLLFTLDQLRARVADAEAANAIARARWDVAAAFVDRSLSLDPTRAGPYLHRAWILVATGRIADAAAALAPVIEHNPVWLYAELVSTPALAPLLRQPAIRALVAAQPGRLEAKLGELSVEQEPTGRFLAIYSDSGSVNGLPRLCGVFTIIERATLDVKAELPINTCGSTTTDVQAQHRTAETTLRALGFVPATGESATLSFGDSHMHWFPHQHVSWPDAHLDLVSTWDKQDHNHVAVDLPPRPELVDAVLFGEVVVVRWRYPKPGVGFARRPKPSPPVIAPAPPTNHVSHAKLPAPTRWWPLAVLGLLVALLLVRRSGPVTPDRR